jgi:hypothetical protein
LAKKKKKGNGQYSNQPELKVKTTHGISCLLNANKLLAKKKRKEKKREVNTQ